MIVYNVNIVYNNYNVYNVKSDILLFLIIELNLALSFLILIILGMIILYFGKKVEKIDEVEYWLKEYGDDPKNWEAVGKGFYSNFSSGIGGKNSAKSKRESNFRRLLSDMIIPASLKEKLPVELTNALNKDPSLVNTLLDVLGTSLSKGLRSGGAQLLNNLSESGSLNELQQIIFEKLIPSQKSDEDK